MFGVLAVRLAVSDRRPVDAGLAAQDAEQRQQEQRADQVVEREEDLAVTVALFCHRLFIYGEQEHIQLFEW